MIQPTVGRVVWYHPRNTDPLGDEANHPNRRYAAIVTQVWGDCCVNLAIFDPNGTPFARTSVVLVHDTPTNPGQCEWMPYQKGQAAKTEALEKKLGG